MFVALGLGMALPYALLAWFPGGDAVLPRPGAWMERLKQVLAFPLYATVAWLVWVLGAQVDNDAVVRLLVTLVVHRAGAVGVARLQGRPRPRVGRGRVRGAGVGAAWSSGRCCAVATRTRRRP